MSMQTGDIKALTNFTDSNLIVDYPSSSADGKRVFFGLHKKIAYIHILENF
jgi:hypothetical protein